MGNSEVLAGCRPRRPSAPNAHSTAGSFAQEVKFVWTTVLGCTLVSAAAMAAGSTDPLTFAGFSRDMLLEGAHDVALSSGGSRVYVASTDDSAISIFQRSVSTGMLYWETAVSASDLDPNVLEEPIAVAVSPDEGSVYVASSSGLAVFSRSSGSGLTFLEIHRDGEGGLTTLQDPSDVVVTPDDKHVLVTAQADDSLVVFTRDRSTGRLTFLQSMVDGIGGVDGLEFPRGVAVTADGTSVYATGRSDDAVAAFRRDPVTGLLTYLDVYKNSYIGISGLWGAEYVEASSDGANVYVTGRMDDTVAVFERNETTGLLTFVHSIENGSDGVVGLAGIRRIALSPDGQHLYAIAASDSTVAIFSRSPTDGALSQIGVVSEGVGGVRVFRSPHGITVSSDGASVIVASLSTGILTLARDPVTGLLSHVDSEYSAPGLKGAVGITTAFSPCVFVAGNLAGGVQSLRRQGPEDGLVAVSDFIPAIHTFLGTRSVATSRDQRHFYFAGHDTNDIVLARYGGSTPCVIGGVAYLTYREGEGGIVGLVGPQHLALSPDEAHLYVASELVDAVVVFTRDTTYGDLTYLETVFDGTGGVDGLAGAYWVEVSPDGAQVYVAGYVDDAIAVLSRNPSTGSLTFGSVVRDGVDGVNGLNGCSGVVVSPDGQHVYAAGRLDNSVAMFGRNPTSGALTYIGRALDGAGGIDGLGGARAVASSPDGEQIYVASQFDDALAVFSRNPVSGLLTQVGLHRDGVSGVNGLATANGIAVSPDGVQIYVTGYDDNAIATFVRSELVIFADGFESAGSDAWTATVGSP